MKQKPKVLEIKYDIDWFINEAKKECVKLKYKEEDIDCAFGNLNLIYKSMIDAIYDNKVYYNNLIRIDPVDFSISIIHHHTIRVDSSFKFSKLIHSEALYENTVRKIRKFSNCYYPAIQLIDVMLIAGSKLLDNHRDEIWKIIITGGYEYQNTLMFTASRIDDTDKISFTLSIYPVCITPDQNGVKTNWY